MSSHLPDRVTIGPSHAEAVVAYYRKSIAAVIPLILAGVLVIYNAVQAGTPILGVTWVTALFAVVQAAGTYFPDSAVAKAGVSLLGAVGGAVTAVFTSGTSTAELLLVLVQLMTWAAAASIPNGAHPSVVAAAQLDDDPRVI